MASYSTHEVKYITNKHILEEQLFDKSNTEYYDWAITIAFYASLHLVEMKLHKLKLDTVATTHKGRKKLLDSNQVFKPIVEDYKELLDLSYDSRYSAKCNYKKVEAAYECLKNIENYLQELVPAV